MPTLGNTSKLMHKYKHTYSTQKTLWKQLAEIPQISFFLLFKVWRQDGFPGVSHLFPIILNFLSVLQCLETEWVSRIFSFKHVKL